MRRLLRGSALAILVALAAILQTRESLAASTVYNYVLHPTGLTGMQTINSKLNCGWHDVCDGV